MPLSNERVNVSLGHQMGGYLSEPGGPGPFPGVVVIHAGTGVDTFVRDIVDRLAAEGYVALAPQIFHRVTPEMTADGSLPYLFLSDPEIIDDVNATVEYLRRRGTVNMDRVGILGYCIGGRIAYLTSAVTSHFKAMVPYHPGNIMVPWGAATQSPFELTGQISCPMLVQFGEIDPNPSQEDMAKLDGELTRLDKPHTFYTYPGAGHAFMDHTDKRYHQPSAEASWPRTLEFLATHLK